MPIPFDRDFDAPAGVPQKLTPLVTRLLADNPGIFTFRGTGVYIVGAGKSVAVIDPGPDSAPHLAALKKSLAGRQVSHILITHTHSDHSPAARAVKAWTGAKVYAFGPHPARYTEEGPRVEEGGDRNFMPDLKLADGDIIEGEGFTLHALHTPGHMSNHLCYALDQENALFTGDHVMGWSTTVVAPPDGDMTEYMASLERLIARNDAVLYPTHGGPIIKPKRFLRAYREHRLAREAAILACVEEGITAIPAIVEKLYVDVDRELYPAAGRSVEAHLIKLKREGRI